MVIEPSTNSMANLYEKVWNEFFNKKPKGIQEAIINNPDGREASELAHNVAREAESRYVDSDNIPF